MSSITYASFANLINTPSKQKQNPPPPSSDGSLSSTVFVPRSISPTPSLGWDSPQISHRSMPGTPNTEAFSSLPSSRSPTPSPVNMYQRHDKYYIQDEMDEFLVEDTLFHVHRYHLDIESNGSFPRKPDNRREPISLVGVSKLEFESLLDFFYKSMHKEEVPPLSHWSALLSISTRYDMARIRARSIHEINTFRPRILPIPQIVLAVAHNVPEWLPLAYAGLTARDEPIQVDEAISIGLEKTVRLSMAREEIRKMRKEKYSVEEVNNAVYKVFWPGEEVPASVTESVSELFGTAAEPSAPSPPLPEFQPEVEEVDEQGDEEAPTSAAVIEQARRKERKGKGGGKTNSKVESAPGSGTATPIPRKKTVAKAKSEDQPKGANKDEPVSAPVSGVNASPGASKENEDNGDESPVATSESTTKPAIKTTGSSPATTSATKSTGELPVENSPATKSTEDTFAANSSVTHPTDVPPAANSSAKNPTNSPTATNSSATNPTNGVPAANSSGTNSTNGPPAGDFSTTNPVGDLPAANSSATKPTDDSLATKSLTTESTKNENETATAPIAPTLETIPPSPTGPSTPTTPAADDEGDGDKYQLVNGKWMCKDCRRTKKRCNCPWD